ncbi:MAG: SGNH/GDSL hydrolase family protein [Planctomycetia bacterium]|nr:SGNH/GDSL hydrolase family protein [Planctomycetia bacterium]
MTRFHFLRLIAMALVASFFGNVATRGAAPEKSRPRVLIIGDSISLGYTSLVKQKLEAVADVLRPNENCQHTAHGLKQIDAWLGDGKWDVIHFNWGIWDTHLLGPSGNLVFPEPVEQGQLKQRHAPDEYRKNLTQLVEKMQKTGATLIWASTTPITSRKGERFEAIKQLNAAAAEVAASHDVVINDLYEFVLPNAGMWLAGDQVHFNGPGNIQLADRVSESILKALTKRGEVKASPK